MYYFFGLLYLHSLIPDKTVRQLILFLDFFKLFLPFVVVGQRVTAEWRSLGVVVDGRHLILPPLLIHLKIESIQLKIQIATKSVVFLQIFDLVELFFSQMWLFDDFFFADCGG